MEIERRNRWIGIIIGAGLIAGIFYIGVFLLGLFFIMNAFLFHIIFSLTGGFVAGVFSNANVKDGTQSGAITGFIGSMIIAVSIIWVLVTALMHGTPDFISGMGIPIGLFLNVIAILFASAGGGIGAICKKALFGEGKKGRQQPEKPSG